MHSRTHARPPRPRRVAISVIALAVLVVHLAASANLSRFARSLDSALDDNDDDGGGGGGRGIAASRDAAHASLYGIVTLIGIARVWSLCSVGIACVGLYSIYKSNLALLRLFTLNTLLSIALDLFLVLLTLVLLSVSNGDAGGRAFATTLCQALSNQNSLPDRDASSSSASGGGGGASWWPDLLGLSLEECEDRFDDGRVVSSVLFALAVVEGVRALAGVKLLAYYTALAKSLVTGGRGRHAAAEAGYQPIPMVDSGTPAASSASSKTAKRSNSGARAGRGQGLRVDTELASIGGADGRDRFTDSPIEHLDVVASPSSGRDHGVERRTSGASSKPRRDNTRILVLPRTSAAALDRPDVPAVSVTPSTPSRSTFPPPESDGSSPLRPTARESKMVLVYQPVMMTVEEARLHGASEVALSPRRTRAHSFTAAPASHPTPSSSRSDRRSRSSTITPSSLAAAAAAAVANAGPSTGGGESPTARPLTVVTRTPPPPPPSSSSSLRDLVRHGDDSAANDDDLVDLLTPRGTTTAGQVVGLAGLLRGDLELDPSRPPRLSDDKKRA
ncbi:hypothetical protein JCM11491_005149 [Sporobolomyces phaffii]